MIALLDYYNVDIYLMQRNCRCWAQIDLYFSSMSIVTKNILLLQFQCLMCDCLVLSDIVIRYPRTDTYTYTVFLLFTTCRYQVMTQVHITTQIRFCHPTTFITTIRCFVNSFTETYTYWSISYVSGNCLNEISCSINSLSTCFIIGMTKSNKTSICYYKKM